MLPVYCHLFSPPNAHNGNGLLYHFVYQYENVFKRIACCTHNYFVHRKFYLRAQWLNTFAAATQIRHNRIPYFYVLNLHK